MLDMNLSIPDELIAKIKALPKPALIAIGGLGGSGKSTLAEALQNNLPSVASVPMDDFIVKDKVLEAWDKGAFDRARLESQVLKPLSKGKPVKYQKLLWASNTLSDFIELPQSDVTIVEGISSYHPDIAHYYDFKIWVEAPVAVARERGRARDGDNENAQHWDLWAKNDLEYQKSFQPERTADFIFINR
jgi:uridine kinase